ncbi:MAG: PDZ domain-containing protein [Myxococcota bacterium]
MHRLLRIALAIVALPLWLCSSGLFIPALAHSGAHAFVATWLGIPFRGSIGLGWEWFASSDGRFRAALLPGSYVRGDLDDVPWPQALTFLAAGPLASLLMATVAPFLLLVAVGATGVSVPAPVVGDIPVNRALQLDDVITEVDGQSVTTWSGAMEAFGDGPAQVTVTRDGSPVQLTVPSLQEASPFPPSNTIGVGDPDSPLARAGLQSGHHVVEINGRTTETHHDVAEVLEVITEAAVVLGDGQRVLAVREAGEAWGLERADLYVRVIPGLAAEEAGMLDGDRIVALDGVPIERWFQLGEELQRNPEARRTLTVQRQGKALDLTIQPRLFDINGEPTYQIGVNSMGGSARAKQTALDHFGPERALTVLTGFYQQFGSLFTGVTRLPQGPGSPSVLTPDSADRGLRYILGLCASLVFVNSLLVLWNLLPLPFSDLTALVDQVAKRQYDVQLPIATYELWGARLAAGGLGLVVGIIFATDFLRFLNA